MGSMTSTPSRDAGWYDDPEGRRRWWDGQRWGAYAPWSESGVPRPSAPRPGARIDRRYLHDGTASGRAAAPQQQVVVHHVVHLPAKDLAIAYLLLVFLGVFGAHRFYLGHNGTAIALLCGTLLAAPLMLVGGGIMLAIGVGIWWVVDLFLLPGMTRCANARTPQPPSFQRGWPAA